MKWRIRPTFARSSWQQADPWVRTRWRENVVSRYNKSFGRRHQRYRHYRRRFMPHHRQLVSNFLRDKIHRRRMRNPEWLARMARRRAAFALRQQERDFLQQRQRQVRADRAYHTTGRYANTLRAWRRMQRRDIRANRFFLRGRRLNSFGRLLEDNLLPGYMARDFARMGAMQRDQRDFYNDDDAHQFDYLGGD